MVSATWEIGERSSPPPAGEGSTDGLAGERKNQPTALPVWTSPTTPPRCSLLFPFPILCFGASMVFPRNFSPQRHRDKEKSGRSDLQIGYGPDPEPARSVAQTPRQGGRTGCLPVVVDAQAGRMRHPRKTCRLAGSAPRITALPQWPRPTSQFQMSLRDYLLAILQNTTVPIGLDFAELDFDPQGVDSITDRITDGAGRFGFSDLGLGSYSAISGFACKGLTWLT